MEVATRIKSHYPNGQKLKYQSRDSWLPNAAFVNCYEGGAESVGYHSDQLTYRQSFSLQKTHSLTLYSWPPCHHRQHLSRRGP